MKIEDAIKIIKEVKSYYPVFIFPEPEDGCSVDRYTAAGCRLACDNILMIIDKSLNEEEKFRNKEFRKRIKNILNKFFSLNSTIRYGKIDYAVSEIMEFFHEWENENSNINNTAENKKTDIK